MPRARSSSEVAESHDVQSCEPRTPTVVRGDDGASVRCGGDELHRVGSPQGRVGRPEFRHGAKLIAIDVDDPKAAAVTVGRCL